MCSIREGGTAPGIEIIKVQVATPNQVTPEVTFPVDVGEDIGAGLSPDGQTIVLAAGESKSDVWLMEDFAP